MVRSLSACVAAACPDRADGLHLPHGLYRRGEIYHRGPSVLQGHNNHVLSSRITEDLQMVHNWPSTVYILPTVVFTLLYNIPRFFELTTRTVTCTEEVARVNNCSLNTSETYVAATEFRRDIYYRQARNQNL